ncbi:hypothetical protein [Nocardia fluminea]|uniref:hypothetical protein n=1 Tax=Nocardia fluminea TaxID=134984 RepID=UPI00364D8704
MTAAIRENVERETSMFATRGLDIVRNRAVSESFAAVLHRKNNGRDKEHLVVVLTLADFLVVVVVVNEVIDLLREAGAA